MTPFAEALSGGHPNSLGRTVEVVEAVLADPARIDELFACYGAVDPVVRLRTSNALKRIEAERRDLVLPLADRLIGEVGAMDQPSARWTVAQLADRMWPDLTADQRAAAVARGRAYLDAETDWIVLNAAMDLLGRRDTDTADGIDWLRPRLDRLAGDGRKSVAGRARRWRAALGG